MEDKIVLSEYTQYPYTATVYKANDEYGVLMYIAEEDHNEVKFFSNEEDAENFAEDWVTKK